MRGQLGTALTPGSRGPWSHAQTTSSLRGRICFAIRTFSIPPPEQQSSFADASVFLACFSSHWCVGSLRRDGSRLLSEVDVVGRPCISVTLKVSNFTQYLLNVDSGVDNTAVDMNDSSVAVATTEGCCTNSLPAARAAVYLFLYRARTLSQQPRAFDRAIL